MSSADEVGVRRRVWPGPDQAVLRGLVLLGSTLPLLAADAAGAETPVWLQVLVLGLALVLALRPDSAAGIVVLLGSAYAWARVPETLSPLVLLALAGMLLVHLAALVAAQGPGRVRVDPRQVVLWTGRGVLLALAGAAVWAGGRALADVEPGRAAYGAGLALLAALALLSTWLLVERRPG